ncbi:MAG: glycoside hydrolase family 3 C-terminal domain-containing protein [Clostridia bacterium]|nr:glycoside hydrolase family 3 C-terminal domain-containing protein [Clostridia bacterium]
MNVEERITELITKMTLEEKVSLCHGATLFKTGAVERLGITAVTMSDGPHGIREELKDDVFEPLGLAEDASTYFCALIALAATWNTELAYEYGNGIGEEAKARGKDILLSPGINIIRTPLCGRNFEYLSEDPYLVSKLVVPMIRGIQEQGTAACVKHFALNNQETNRLQVDVRVSDRALREIYLPGFKAAVEEGQVYAVMGAYNRFRGQHCCHHEYLLKDILKGEWGFDGVVISDWSGTHDTVEAANCGLDIEMGTIAPFEEYYLAKPFLNAIKSGMISEAVLDDKVRRILRLAFRIGKFDQVRPKGSFNTREHQFTSLRIGRESITLLKNEDGLLPLRKEALKTIAVIGDNADHLQGSGGGSSGVKALYEVTPLQGLHNKLGENTEIIFARGYSNDPAKAEELRAEAVRIAAGADAVVIFGGLNHGDDAEDHDRTDLKLPNGQNELIQEVYNVNPKAVVILIGGSPMEMDPWIQDVKGVLLAWYSGMEAGNAIAEVLLGDVNPSGKLPVTFPRRLEDSPAHSIGEYPGDTSVEYKEGIFVGYRYYDKKEILPLFCFGHGLSYTTFQYSDLKVFDGGRNGGANIEVSFNIRNTGSAEGAETVQLYVKSIQPETERPVMELKGFKKVFLEPGETQKVSLTMDPSSFSYYCEEKKAWRMDAGKYELLVGSSSRDIRFTEKIDLKHCSMI